MPRFILVLIFVLTAARAGADSCTPATFTQDTPQAMPTGFAATDEVELLSAGKPVPGSPVEIHADGTFTVKGSAVGLATTPIVRWTKAGGGATCDQSPGTGAAATRAGASNVVEQCVREGARASLEVKRAFNGSDNYVVILLSNEGVCYASKHFSTEGDSLFIGYARDDGTTAILEYDKCEVASAIPKVLAGDLSQIEPEAGRAPAFGVQWFVPVAQCFGTSVQFHLNKAGAAKFVSAQLTQYERYRATLQLGAAFSTRHIESFGLATIGGKQVLVSKGPDQSRAPEYLASVVIYGLPRYFMRQRVSEPAFLPGSAIAGERKVPYFGREPVHETGWQDRLGAMFGAGLSQPGRRFVAGLTFELVTGVNVFGGGEFVKLTTLNGYEPGQEFAGAVDTIPLRDDWQGGTVIGVSFDARYATALFGKK